MQESRVLNAFNTQKSIFLRQIGEVSDGDSLYRILQALESHLCLWVSIGVGYKVGDLARDIISKVDKLDSELPANARGRKNVLRGIKEYAQDLSRLAVDLHAWTSTGMIEDFLAFAAKEESLWEAYRKAHQQWN